LAEKVPDLKMVIVHFAKPPIKEKQMGTWADEFAAAHSIQMFILKFPA
jgi:L-fuconolactonase